MTTAADSVACCSYRPGDWRCLIVLVLSADDVAAPVDVVAAVIESAARRPACLPTRPPTLVEETGCDYCS